MLPNLASCFAFMLHLLSQSGMFLEVIKQVSSRFPLLQHLQLLIFSWRAFLSLSWGFTFLFWTGGHYWDLLCALCGKDVGLKKINSFSLSYFCFIEKASETSLKRGLLVLVPKLTKLWSDSSFFLVRSIGQTENSCRLWVLERLILRGKKQKRNSFKMQKRICVAKNQSTYSGKNGHTQSKPKSRVLSMIQIELPWMSYLAIADIWVVAFIYPNEMPPVVSLWNATRFSRRTGYILIVPAWMILYSLHSHPQHRLPTGLW